MDVYVEEEHTKRYDWRLWKKLFAFIKPYKKYVFLLSLVMILVGVIDAFFPIMSKYAIDNFVVIRSTQGLKGFVLSYALLVVVQAFNVWLLIVIAGKIETGICYDFRRDGFRHLQELSLSYYDTTPVGWTMARMTSDIQKLSETISWGLVDMIWGVTMMLAIVCFMILLDVKLALITLSVVPPLVLISIYFRHKILNAHRLVRKTNSQISRAYNEGITGARTTKSLVREQENLREFQTITTDMYRSSVRAIVFSSLYLPMVLTLASIGTGVALWFGGEGVQSLTLSYGTLVAFLSYTVQFFEPIQELARVLSELQSAQASAERVISMIETEPQIQDLPEVKAKFGDFYRPKKENWQKMEGNIEFRNVTFSYRQGEAVLEGLTLKVDAGETIALVGETGSGKSTIVSLACRFYEPTSGQIFVDGVDYRERSLAWYHSHLGYVLQTPHLFNTTIRENICYGRRGATEAEIIEAAKLVEAHDFIRAMPKGYDSEVGEGGDLLSTGQKQLISFARAILADPVIFILDEATSSVDTATEQMIQSAIQRVLKGRTSFIIAHRLSTVRCADRILVIQRGRIVEEGDHSSLLHMRGSYYRFYTQQFSKEEAARLLNERGS